MSKVSCLRKQQHQIGIIRYFKPGTFRLPLTTWLWCFTLLQHEWAGGALLTGEIVYPAVNGDLVLTGEVVYPAVLMGTWY